MVLWRSAAALPYPPNHQSMMYDVVIDNYINLYCMYEERGTQHTYIYDIHLNTKTNLNSVAQKCTVGARTGSCTRLQEHTFCTLCIMLTIISYYKLTSALT